VGFIGFKGYPNTRGETEIGYGIDESFRNQGYMTEAITILSRWAFENPECQAITATSVSNPASERVLQKLKWDKIRQTDKSSDWDYARISPVKIVGGKQAVWAPTGVKLVDNSTRTVKFSV